MEWLMNGIRYDSQTEATEMEFAVSRDGRGNSQVDHVLHGRCAARPVGVVRSGVVRFVDGDDCVAHGLRCHLPVEVLEGQG